MLMNMRESPQFNVNADMAIRARDLNCDSSLHLCQYFGYVSSQGSGGSVNLLRLTRTFIAQCLAI